MKTYAIYFKGYYPIGAVAIVTANNEDVARQLLIKELKDNYLFDDIELFDIEKLDISKNNVKVLLDGNY